jgi:hypothetical protein
MRLRVSPLVCCTPGPCLIAKSYSRRMRAQRASLPVNRGSVMRNRRGWGSVTRVKCLPCLVARYRTSSSFLTHSSSQVQYLILIPHHSPLHASTQVMLCDKLKRGEVHGEESCTKMLCDELKRGEVYGEESYTNMPKGLNGIRGESTEGRCKLLQ